VAGQEAGTRRAVRETPAVGPMSTVSRHSGLGGASVAGARHAMVSTRWPG